MFAIRKHIQSALSNFLIAVGLNLQEVHEAKWFRGTNLGPRIKYWLRYHGHRIHDCGYHITYANPRDLAVSLHCLWWLMQLNHHQKVRANVYEISEAHARGKDLGTQ